MKEIEKLQKELENNNIRCILYQNKLKILDLQNKKYEEFVEKIVEIVEKNKEIVNKIKNILYT